MLVSFFSLVAIDVHVLGARVLPDDHALVDLGAGADEHAPALLQVEQRERRDRRRGGRRPASRSGGSAARRATARTAAKTWCSRPVPRVSVRNSVRKPIRPRAGTRYSRRIQPVPWLTICSIRPLRRASSWVSTPEVVLGRVDGQVLHRLAEPAVDRPRHHLRLADGDLEPLAAHQLDEDRELQLAAPLDLPGVGPLGLEQPDAHVADRARRPAGCCSSRAVSLVPDWPGQR